MRKPHAHRIGAGSRPLRPRSRGRAAALALALVSGVSPAFAGGGGPLDHTEFDALLRKYVSPSGVRYAEWHADAQDRSALGVYLRRMQEVPVSRVADSPGGEAEALAFWINLYNAATLDLVLRGYPVKSIKDLGGLLKSPWEKDVVVVEGRKLTLNSIENDVIRPTFGEPRIHFALNCAARSCPPLRAEAYVGDRLEQQLDEQTRRFLADEAANRLEAGPRLRLSKIFDWYAEDFERAAGSVVGWVRPYVPALAGKDLDEIEIRHGDYDWRLNEAPAGR